MSIALGLDPKSRIIQRMGSSWSFRDGEQARLVAGPAILAEITSRGRLPLRPRSEGSFRLRAPLPGTAVVLGDRTFEVMEECLESDRVTYRLRPWETNEVQRGLVVYDEAFVRTASIERERALVRERARPWQALLYPLVGSLPEDEQARLAERYGLDTVGATIASALTELLLVFLVVGLVASRSGSALAILMVVNAPAIAFIPLLALGRTFSAIALHETSGQWCVVLVVKLWRSVLPLPQLVGFVPLTRGRFFRLLEEPDEIA